MRFVALVYLVLLTSTSVGAEDAPCLRSEACIGARYGAACERLGIAQNDSRFIACLRNLADMFRGEPIADSRPVVAPPTPKYSKAAEVKYGYVCQADGTPNSKAWQECLQRSEAQGSSSCYQAEGVYGPCRPRGGVPADTPDSSASAANTQRTCGEIRQEIARQRSIANYSRQQAAESAAMQAQQRAAAQRNPLSPVPVQLPSQLPQIEAQVAQNIAELETRAANLACTAAFSTSIAPNPSSFAPMTFDDCFAKCKELTRRTDEQCFESCKR